MGVIRSNYSTLSAIGQEEAPDAPEYPYSEMVEAYRNLIREGHASDEEDEWDVSPPASNHTTSFKRILKHFFNDYFKEDADEEIASDMARRWIAFARSGDPNYDEGKVEWIPWRYIPKIESDGPIDRTNYVSLDEHDYYAIWSQIEEDEATEQQQNETSSFAWVQDQVGRAYRRRALQALSMEVVEEDELRTELKRTKTSHHDPDNPFFSFNLLEKLGITSREQVTEGKFPKETIRQIQKIAQDLGVLGTGMNGDSRRALSFWDDDFFPQLLELKWPPEGRLVERDCSCDFWERIRCKPLMRNARIMSYASNKSVSQDRY